MMYWDRHKGDPLPLVRRTKWEGVTFLLSGGIRQEGRKPTPRFIPSVLLEVKSRQGSTYLLAISKQSQARTILSNIKAVTYRHIHDIYNNIHKSHWEHLITKKAKDSTLPVISVKRISFSCCPCVMVMDPLSISEPLVFKISTRNSQERYTFEELLFGLKTAKPKSKQNWQKYVTKPNASYLNLEWQRIDVLFILQEKRKTSDYSQVVVK